MIEATLKINIAALYNNAKYLIEKTNGGVIATVKNNAYNFGLEKVLHTFYNAGIRAFSTTSLKDSIYIRELYPNVMVFLLNPCEEFELLRKYKISCTLPSYDFLLKNKENMYDIYWHLEWAGIMRRSGCRSEEEFFQALEFASNNNINIDGIWTHFSYADEFDDKNTYLTEKSRWIDIQKKACSLCDFQYVHSQNSPSFARDGKLEGHTHIRPGIFLYGCMPYEIESTSEVYNKIQHVLDLTASVISIINLDLGESIGYCSSYVAEKDNTRLAVINIGYGDGLKRERIKNNTVEINGRRYELVSIMMSHTVAIVDNSVNVGDIARYYGKEIPVHEFTFRGVGSCSEQISYFNHNTLNVVYENIEYLGQVK